MSYKTLIGYQKAFGLAMKVFQISKKFPKEEMFGLTGQVRRSSRSVCSNIAEGYRKRKYEAHFVSKMTDADMENTETQGCGWILPWPANIFRKVSTTNCMLHRMRWENCLPI